MKRIVVLGAGYAGIKSVVALQKKLRQEVKITLVDRNPYHYETVRLYEIASGKNDYTKISYPIADVIDPKMTDFVQDNVKRINYRDKTVELENHAPLKYDYCVIGLGFTLNTMGIEGAEENAMPMYNPKSAAKIRDHIYASMKDYRKTKNPNDLVITVCGAGFQAVELANSFAVARPRFAKIAGVDPSEIKIRMFDGSPRLLPMFGEKQLNYALTKIKQNDIEIISPARITKVFSDMVYYKLGKDEEEKTLGTNNIIWMMGFSGNPVISASGFKERRDKVMVSDHLTAPESDDVYVLGDVSAVMIPGKTWPWPNTGQLALSMANYAAKDLRARVMGHSRPNKYEYNDLGVVVDLGKSAVGIAMGAKIYGWVARAMKRIIIDKSIMETGGIKETLSIGRFDFFG